MDAVRFAVVGCGNIGSRHLAILDAQPGVRLTGFCDVDAATLARFEQLYPNARAFPTIDALLRDVDADVVTVCTPHYLHAEHAQLVVGSRRHALVEKPMAIRSGDAVRMIESARQAGVLLLVVKQNRYNKPVALVRDALDRGALGRILMAECNVIWNRRDSYYSNSPWLGRRAFEGGALYTQVSHFIDLLIWFCGDVVDAGGFIDTKNHAVEVEDCGAAWLRFSGGTLASLCWTTCAHEKNFEGSIVLICEKGVVKIGGQYLNQIDHWNVGDLPLPDGIEWTDQPNAYGHHQGTSSNHDKVFADVVRRVRSEADRVVAGEEALRTVRAIELIYAKCRNGADGRTSNA